LDAPGVLHHVMARGIERRPIFIDDRDRDEFVRRLSDLALEGKLIVYAWSLMPNENGVKSTVDPNENGVKSTVDPCSKLIRVKSRLDPIYIHRRAICGTSINK
jgi:hypothetical protein